MTASTRPMRGMFESWRIPGAPVLCTFPVIGKRLLDQFGYVYYPGYKVLYSDTEQTDVFDAMGRLVFVDKMIIEHRHPVLGKAPMDGTYQHNVTHGQSDKSLYEKRKDVRRPYAQWTFDSPPIWLSILIASTIDRAPLLHKLVDHLYTQIGSYPREVEILVNVDDRKTPIGEKRNQLLKRAKGHFIAFVDDDDWVVQNYVERIVDAISSHYADGSPLDCIALDGVMTINDGVAEDFHHSIVYRTWYHQDVGGGYKVYFRPPNHLNAVRRVLALEAGFPLISEGEDKSYSAKLLPLLKYEAKPTGEGPLYYYWYRRKNEARP